MTNYKVYILIWRKNNYMSTITLEKNFDYFLKSNFDEFKEGEWVAIFENRVIAHGNELKKVIEEVKKIMPLSKVLISKVKKTARYL